MSKIKIGITNKQCFLTGDRKIILAAYKYFSVKHPSAFHIRRYMPKGWDGMFHYINDRGAFRTGLLDRVLEFLEKYEVDITYVDERDDVEKNPIIPDVIGGLTPRPYQHEAISSIVHNTIPGTSIPWHRGVIKAATNAGKTMITAGIYQSFGRKKKALVLINDSDLYTQFHTEIPELVGDDAGFVRGKEKDWNRFTVGMVQTISQNLAKMKRMLAQYEMVLVDEADLADNKSYKRVLEACINATIRVGLSGSIFTSKLVKDKPKNLNLESYFGPERFVITKEELVKLGHSTPLVIKITPGNTKKLSGNDWQAQYHEGITTNRDRNLKILIRTLYNLQRNRFPLLVVAQFHEHIEILHELFEEQLGSKYTIAAVHHKTKGRKDIIKMFKDGDIDILISSMIIKRGKNLPLLKCLLNAGAGDSQENLIQIMGRGERKHESKKKTYMEDFMDEGTYLKRHSNHRVNYYIQEKFKVIQLYRKVLLKTKAYRKWLRRKK